MLCGDPATFALKWEVKSIGDGDWIHGHLLFLIAGHEVGDYEDLVALNACRNWIRDFVDKPIDRFEPGLFEMDKDLAFKLLAHTVLPDGERDFPELEQCDPEKAQAFERVAHALMSGFERRSPIEAWSQIYGRFDVLHLGMSAMDRYILLLMTSEAGESRFIWQEMDGEITDARVPAGLVERVFIDWLKQMDELVS